MNKSTRSSRHQIDLDETNETQSLKWDSANKIENESKCLSILKIAPSEIKQLFQSKNIKVYQVVGTNRSIKSIPFTYGEAQRMIQFEFNQTNSNVTAQKVYYKFAIENTIYLFDMDNGVSCDDYVDAINRLFIVDSSVESTAPITLYTAGPRVMGGRIHDMNHACSSLLKIRRLKFPAKFKYEDDCCVDNSSYVNIPNTENHSHLSCSTLTTQTINEPFKVNKSEVFKFENKKKDIGSNLSTAIHTTANGESNTKSDLKKKDQQLSDSSINFKNNEKSKIFQTNVGLNLPIPIFKVNETIDCYLKTVHNKWLHPINGCLKKHQKPIYFSSKPLLDDSKEYYVFNESEKKRYYDELHYDMDGEDLSFLIYINIKRIIDWKNNGYNFFDDEDTEKKFKESLSGMNPSSWNYFVDNLLLPGIVAECLPQNCTKDVTKLLVNGITFESIIDKLERLAKYESRNLLGEVVSPNSSLQESYCEICHDDECSVGNVIVYCDVCNVGVHQECYGIPYVPDDAWICQRCNASPSNTITCCLCPNNFGVMKQTIDQQWCHMICALWIPDISFSNSVFLEPIDISKLSHERLKLSCYICGIKSGACIQCMNVTCYVAMHVSCAQSAGLLIFQVNKRYGNSGIISEIDTKFRCYCEFHHAKGVNYHKETYTEVDDKKYTEIRHIMCKRINNDTNPADKRSRPSRTTYQPILQISCIDSLHLKELSQQLPLFKSNELIYDIYQYWLIRRYMRYGTPLIRGLTACNNSLCNSRNGNQTNNISNNTQDSGSNQENYDDKSSEKVATDPQLISKYEKIKTDFKSSKNVLNNLIVIEYILSFEIVVYNIIKMFIELVLQQLSSSHEIAIKVHNIRAYMIRNLALFDPKCPSHLKNIIYPLNLFDSLLNFSMFYLNKLYELSPQQNQQHATTRTNYYKIFMAIRVIVERRFPIGKFKFDFINTFKDQIRQKNYTMSHDIYDEHLTVEKDIEHVKSNEEKEMPLYDAVNHSQDRAPTIEQENEKSADFNFENNDINSTPLINATNSDNITELDEITQIAASSSRKARKGKPEKTPTLYDAAKNFLFESIASIASKRKMSSHEQIETPNSSDESTKTDMSVIEDTDAVGEEVSPILVVSEVDRNDNIAKNIVPLEAPNKSPKNLVSNSNKSSEVHISLKNDTDNIDISTFNNIGTKNQVEKDLVEPSDDAACLIRNESNKNTKILTRQVKRSLMDNSSNSSEHTSSADKKSSIQTRRKNSSYLTTSTDDIVDASSSLIKSKKSDLQKLSSNQLTKRSIIASSKHSSNNSTNRMHNTTTIANIDNQQDLNKSTIRPKKRSINSSNSSLSSIKPKKVTKLNDNSTKSIDFTSSSVFRVKKRIPLDLFDLVESTNIYYESIDPFIIISDPKKRPSILSEYTVVWAKMPGFAPYPGVIVTPKSSKEILSKLKITRINFELIKSYITKKYDSYNEISKNHMYIVVFFDSGHTFQILSRASLEPLGVDRYLDNIRILNFFTSKNTPKLKVDFINGYKYALKMVSKLKKSS